MTWDFHPRPYQDGIRLTLPERFDRSTAPEVDAALERFSAARPGAVYADLGRASALDSAGLALLLAWHRRLRAARRRLVLVGVDAWHRKVLEITRLDRDLRVEEDEEGVILLERRVANG